MQMPLCEGLKERHSKMWVVIYLAKGKSVVTELRRLLEDNGILVMIRRKTNEADENEAFFEILVPQTEVEAAQDIIIGKN